MSDDRFRCYLCGEFKDAMWGNTCNLCRDKEEKHRDHMKAAARLDKAISMQSMCATLEAKCDSLEKRAAWLEGLLKRAHRIVEDSKALVPLSSFQGSRAHEWLADLERGIEGESK